MDGASAHGRDTPGVDLGVARHVADCIVAAGGPAVRRVILFGSRARGDARPGSDYDLLVLVGPMSSAERDILRSILYRAVEGFGIAVDPRIMSEAEFEESKTVIGGLAYPAWNEGVALYPEVTKAIPNV